jgi:Protein of unknown function DUF262
MNDSRAMQQELDEQRRKVDVDNYTITVRELLSMAERSELHRAPEYQRKFRWNEEAESRLIESILLGLPIPNLFFATNADGTWEVVDGLQRISTLIHFCSDSAEQLKEISKDRSLKLSGLSKLTHFNGLTSEDLPSPIKLSFTKRGLGVTALSDKSDMQARFDTFERLNSGAVALSAQEVRACIYDGPFNDVIRRLAALDAFRQMVKLQSRDQDNATHEELVLKFFAYLEGREAFSGGVRDFLNDFMEGHRDGTGLDDVDELFERVVRELSNILDGPFLRRNTNVTPQNELEAVMVGAAEVLRDHNRLGRPPLGWAVSIDHGDTMLRDQLIEDLDRFLPV